MTYKPYDVVKVPFPFTDKSSTKKRPALVVSNPEYQCNTSHLVLLMITSAKNSHWYSDIEITDLTKAGLKASSVIRFKIFSLDERLIINKIGEILEEDKEKVKSQLSKTIEL